MLANSDKTVQIFTAYEHYFPDNIPETNDLNHELLDQIGQPHKGKMLTLLFAVALNLPNDELKELKQDASESLTQDFKKASLDANEQKKLQFDTQRKAQSNLLSKQDEWITEMRDLMQRIGIRKEDSKPLAKIVEDIDNIPPMLN